jgi:AcrR family transcriptional regulator
MDDVWKAGGGMTGYPQEPTGLARRGRRLSDHETEQRMLATAVAMVNRAGLTVSLEHISLEEVIRAADVSRSAVYRRWPYKDLFFSDLVKELAATATPTVIDEEIALIRRVVADRPGWLDTPELRHGLVVELIRQLALLDFRSLYGSPQWRTYLALQATFLSLADGELRDQVQAALARSEHDHRARVAKAWELLTGLLGYRLRPGLGATFETLATLLGATLRGLVVMALSLPELAAQRAAGSPFGAATREEWSLAALGIAGTASAFLEPDPDVEWNDERRARVRKALSGISAPPVTAATGLRSPERP